MERKRRNLSAPGNRKTLLAAVLFLAVFIVYSPSLGHEFVNWDDGFYVYENAFFDLPALAFLKWAFTSFYAANWHPLTLVSLSIDYKISGLDPFTFHLTNILLHCLNTVLVFLLTLSLIRAGGSNDTRKACWAGIFAALLFGLHPLHVESVSWVSERKDMLSAAFFLIALLSYLKYAEKGAKKWYALTAIAFAAALMSKPMAVTLPFVMFVIDYFPLERIKKGLAPLVLEKVPFIIMSAAVSAATVVAQGEKGAISSGIGLLEKTLVAAKAYVFYIEKAALPMGLAPLYPYPEKVAALSFEYLFPLLVLIAITAAAFKAGRLYRAVWVYYLLTLLPVIGIIHAGPQAAADRYTYLPLAGPFMLAGLGLAEALYARAGQTRKYAVMILAVLFLAVLSLITVRQQSIWRDSTQLWEREIKLYPGSPTGHYNRGMASQVKGEHSEAIEHFSMAVKADPSYIKAYLNRGFSHSATGRFEEAMTDFGKVLKIDPRYAKAYLNRGFHYLQAGETGPAIRDLSEAVRLEPDNGFALYNLAVAYSKAGEKKMAGEFFDRAARSGYSGR